MTRRRTESPAVAWWSEPGPSLCDFCLGTFHVEVGYHCADCDRPICPICIATARERSAVICPECGVEGKPGEPD